MVSTLTIQDQIIVAIRRISQAIQSYSQFLSQEFGLTAPQLGVLRELERKTQSTPSDLAESLHISPQTIAGILKRLEQRDLIARQRSPDDRRSFFLQLTDAGRDLVAKAPPLLRDRFTAELERLEMWERTQLLSVLQRVAAMMSAAEVDETPFLFHSSAEPDKPGPNGAD